MDVCMVGLNATEDIYKDVCLLDDFTLKSNNDEVVHSLPCYDMQLFRQSDFSSVLLMNASQLLSHLGTHKQGMCAVVLFYASWCPFSIKMALFFNAIGRLYQGIPFIAVEIASQINGFAPNQHRFGIISVPNLIVFQNQRAIGRYNESESSVPQLVNFIKKYMNLTSYEIANNCLANDNLTDYKICQDTIYQPIERDELGPIPVVLQEGTDWLLIFSFVILIFVAFFKYKKR